MVLNLWFMNGHRHDAQDSPFQRLIYGLLLRIHYPDRQWNNRVPGHREPFLIHIKIDRNQRSFNARSNLS
mgnify:CR=1 FL=1